MGAPTMKPFPSITLELSSHLHLNQLFPISASFPTTPSPILRRVLCRASKSPPTPLNNRSSSSSSSTNNKNKKKNNNKSSNSVSHDSKTVNNDAVSTLTSDSNSSSLPEVPTPLPKPPAGFVVDDRGRLLSVSKDRLATLVDPTNNLPLECAIRRVFTSSKGHECMLLCPVDMPVQILKSTGDGWSDVTDKELESILPSASYALAKIRMYLVYSGYCYTARGGVCYSEEDIFDFHADGGVPTEGIEITHFSREGAHYMIYTPSDPLLFVAMKGQDGMLQIADDELLEDPAVISAIDEETEFNALVEEEAALLDSLLGKS